MPPKGGPHQKRHSLLSYFPPPSSFQTGCVPFGPGNKRVPRGLPRPPRQLQEAPNTPPRCPQEEAPKKPQHGLQKKSPRGGTQEGGSQAAPRRTPEAGWALQDLVPHDCGMTEDVLPEEAFGPSSSFERFGCPPPLCCCYNTSLITSTRLGVVSGWTGGDTRSVNNFERISASTTPRTQLFVTDPF